MSIPADRIQGPPTLTTAQLKAGSTGVIGVDDAGVMRNKDGTVASGGGPASALTAAQTQRLLDIIAAASLFPASATTAFKAKLSNAGGGSSNQTFLLNTGSKTQTFALTTVLESHAKRFRIWLPNQSASTQPGYKVAIGVSPTIGADGTIARNQNGVTLTEAKFGGAATGTLAAGSGAVNTAVWTATDWMDLATVTRTDAGKSLPVFHVRFSWPTGTLATYTNGPSATGNGWDLENDNVANRPWSVRLQDGDFATNATKAGLTGTAFNNSAWPGIIIEYVPIGSIKPRTMMVNYDSFGSAPGSGINPVNHFGWPEMLQSQYSTLANPIELVNAAFEGAPQNVILATTQAICSVVKSVTALFPNASGNSGGSTLNQAFVDAARQYNTDMRTAYSGAGNTAVIATMSPVDPAIATGRIYGATDSFRVAMNAADVAVSPGVPCADISSACSSAAPNGSGQYVLQNTDDGYHENKVGQVTLVPPAAAALRLV